MTPEPALRVGKLRHAPDTPSTQDAFNDEEISMGFNSESCLAVGTALHDFTVQEDPDASRGAPRRPGRGRGSRRSARSRPVLSRRGPTGGARREQHLMGLEVADLRAVPLMALPQDVRVVPVGERFPARERCVVLCVRCVQEFRDPGRVLGGDEADPLGGPRRRRRAVIPRSVPRPRQPVRPG